MAAGTSLASGLAGRYAAALFDLGVERKALDGIAADGYAFQVETAWRALRAGCVVVEHPITFIDRAYGDSKMDSAIVAEATRLGTSWGIRRLTRRLP